MKANTHIFITRRSVRLRMRKISDELWRENQNTHFVFNDFFFRKMCRLWNMWENIAEPGSPQMTMSSMRIACWIPKSKNTHSEYIILIALVLHQWLHERAPMLPCTYICSCTLWQQHAILQWSMCTKWTASSIQVSGTYNNH